MFVDSSSQGVHIYKLLTDVWQTSKCGIHLYYGLGYGLPLLVVTLSILCNEALDLRGYCTILYCTALYCTVQVRHPAPLLAGPGDRVHLGLHGARGRRGGRQWGHLRDRHDNRQEGDIQARGQ